jgi:hypothetical protein
MKNQMISTPRELYAAVDLLIEDLRSSGHTADADELHVLMNEMVWTTGSELMAELGQVLRKMKGRHTGALRDRIVACLKFSNNHRSIMGLS